MKTLMLALLLISSLRAAEEVPRLHDEYDPAKWPEAHLDFSQAGTLKDVFDSGLRPYRFPGIENSLLEVKHLNLVIQLGSGKILPKIQTELMELTPFRDGEISTIEGFTRGLTLADAREEMLKWLPYGEDGRTEKDLDEYLRAVKADPLDFDDLSRGISHGCSVGWKEPGWKERGGGPQVVAWFRKTTSPTTPLRLYLKISWSSNRASRDRGTNREGPIEPPPGYEHVDMTAPKNFGPDSAVAILRSKGIDIGDGRGGLSEEGDLARQSEADPKPGSGKDSKPGEGDLFKAGYWWWIAAAALALGSVAAWFLCKRGSRVEP